MKSLIYFFIIISFAGFILISCSEEDNPAESQNSPPEIQSVTASPSTITVNGTTSLTCLATDPDQDQLTYSWSSPEGSFPGGSSGSTLQWLAPSTTGSYSIAVTVSDGAETDQDFVSVSVQESGSNLPPNAPSNPNPANNTADVSVNTTLSWTCSDPDGDSLTYDVYFGTLSNPPLVSNDQSETTYDPGTLGSDETYYWKISAFDGELTTEGSLWSFETTAGGVGWNPGEPPTNPSHGDEWTAYMGESEAPLDMIYIGPGSFMQGSPTSEVGHEDDEYPPHLVTLDYGFWLGKYEVTQGQWEAVTGSNPSYYSGANRPVEGVSWNMITADFLSPLNAQTTEGEWRMPSESEWEYGCRAGTTTRFYWGDDLSETLIDDYAVYNGNDPDGTAEVGSKLPNSWNLYDMSGNVWEWVEDYYHSNYTGAPTNGDPWLSPTSSTRVLRGGSWGNYAGYCRSANRGSDSPSDAGGYYGFRIVLSP